MVGTAGAIGLLRAVKFGIDIVRLQKQLKISVGQQILAGGDQTLVPSPYFTYGICKITTLLPDSPSSPTRIITI